MKVLLDSSLRPQDQELQFSYKNYRGEISTRRVLPSKVTFGSSEYHPKPQFFLEGLDIDKGVFRTFAINDIDMDTFVVL